MDNRASGAYLDLLQLTELQQFSAQEILRNIFEILLQFQKGFVI
jgi:hypothetical protein